LTIALVFLVPHQLPLSLAVALLLLGISRGGGLLLEIIRWVRTPARPMDVDDGSTGGGHETMPPVFLLKGGTGLPRILLCPPAGQMRPAVGNPLSWLDEVD
jgi:hypothetical protein